MKRHGRGQKTLHKTWHVVRHLLDDVEPDRISTIVPVTADGKRAKPFCQS